MSLRSALIVAWFLLAVLPVGARSRLPKSNNLTGSSLEMGAGVGWSSLCYTLTDGSNTGAAHFSAHVGYSYFFNRYVGVGFGVDFARYGSSAYYSDALFEWQGVLDSDGERYTHQTQLNRWREVQSLYAVSVPLVAQFAVPINRSLQFMADVGIKYAHTVSSSYAASGDITHRGYYPPWQLTLEDMPPYGFYTTSDFAPSGKLNNKPFSINLIAKFGVVVPLNKQWDLTAKVYLDYGLIDALNRNETAQSIGFRNDREGMAALHNFMNDYTTVLATDQVGKRANLLAVGVEIGVRFKLATPRRCHCLRSHKVAFKPTSHRRRR